MNSLFSLKQALLLSSQNKASLSILVAGCKIDYRLAVSCVSDTAEESTSVYELNVYMMEEGKVAPTPHKSIHITGLDKLVQFVSEYGFVVDSGWMTVEVAQ